MKFLVLFEFCPEDLYKAIEKWKKYMEDIEKTPEKYPEILFPFHATLDKYGGFYVVEATAEQLANQSDYFRTILKYKYVPVLEASKAGELSLKMKE
jgi:hypothetical protein